MAALPAGREGVTAQVSHKSWAMEIAYWYLARRPCRITANAKASAMFQSGPTYTALTPSTPPEPVAVK